MANRYAENTSEDMRKLFANDGLRFSRICDTPVLRRMVGGEELAKLRIKNYGAMDRAVKNMRNWDVENEELDKMRDNFNGRNPYLEMNYEALAPKYFAIFGHGFKTPQFPDGEPTCSREDRWQCPKCRVVHQMPANTLPMRCGCGQKTPMGEYWLMKRHLGGDSV